MPWAAHGPKKSPTVIQDPGHQRVIGAFFGGVLDSAMTPALDLPGASCADTDLPHLSRLHLAVRCGAIRASPVANNGDDDVVDARRNPHYEQTRAGLPTFHGVTAPDSDGAVLELSLQVAV